MSYLAGRLALPAEVQKLEHGHRAAGVGGADADPEEVPYLPASHAACLHEALPSSF